MWRLHSSPPLCTHLPHCVFLKEVSNSKSCLLYGKTSKPPILPNRVIDFYQLRLKAMPPYRGYYGDVMQIVIIINPNGYQTCNVNASLLHNMLVLAISQSTNICSFVISGQRIKLQNAFPSPPDVVPSRTDIFAFLVSLFVPTQIHCLVSGGRADQALPLADTFDLVWCVYLQSCAIRMLTIIKTMLIVDRFLLKISSIDFFKM